MKILVGCEYSGAVRDAFIARGHEAMSCDLLPTDVPGPHYQGDIMDIINDGWDGLICFPPCTYVCGSGLHWNNRGRGWDKTEAAVKFARDLLDAPIANIALENPIGILSTRIRKPNQIIQPWMFGHDASKATCLWLKGFPELVPTDNVCRPAWVQCKMCEDWWCNRHNCHVAECACPEIDTWAAKGDDPYIKRYSNQTPSGQNKLGPSADRWKIRSMTYPGIANAMAEQWSAYFKENP